MLCDESVPRNVATAIASHTVATVQGLGWAGMKNGVLLRAAREAGWEVLITVDRRMEYQQNIPASGLALVVLRVRSTRVAALMPMLPQLQALLPIVQAGTITHLDAA